MGLLRKEVLLISILAVSFIIYNLSYERVIHILEDERIKEPELKVAFLKTHKCGSSTVQNILLRFGYKQNLNFVLPKEGNQLGYTKHFRRSMVNKLPWHRLGYNIFTVHTRWNHHEVEAIMGNDTKYITIMRDPVDLFESLYAYEDFEKLLGKTIVEFAHVVNDSIDLRNSTVMGRNQILYDFGMDDTSDVVNVEKKIQEIDLEFHLVMINEYFDESLILMKDLLHYNLSDFTSLKLNARSDVFKTKLPVDVREKLKAWLWADQMVYEHFLRKFRQKMTEYGESRLANEVQELRDLNAELARKCNVMVSDKRNLPKDLKPWSDRVSGFNVKTSDEECKLLAMGELPFLDMLRKLAIRKSREHPSQRLTLTHM